MTTDTPRRLIVGISGASGAVYGIRMLELLRETGIETHLVISRSAEMTLAYETDFTTKDVRALASVNHPNADIGATISSGSFRTMGMVVAPCSIKTMSEIATGVTSTLLSRAADVTLKERRPLVLMVRESPLHLGHLRTMVQLAEMGAAIVPPVPAFYAGPTDLTAIADQCVGRALDLFGFRWRGVRRWGEDISALAGDGS